MNNNQIKILIKNYFVWINCNKIFNDDGFLKFKRQKLDFLRFNRICKSVVILRPSIFEVAFRVQNPTNRPLRMYIPFRFHCIVKNAIKHEYK